MSHSQPRRDAKRIFKQEMVKFWQNGVFNTQFTTKKVNLNLDLKQNKKLSLIAKRSFSTQNNVKPSLGQKRSFST